MIKVMCVDDQVLLREALLFMLSRDDQICVIDGGNDGYEALENCNIHRPDVILMDIRMPKMDGIEATKRIKELYPSIKVIILTTFEDEASIFRAIEYSADGYVVKDIKPEELLLAVRGVYNNLFIMHKNVISVLKGELVETHLREKEIENTIEILDLSNMEIKIIRHMVDGKSNREIAAALNFTEGTIKNKVSKLLGKLNLKDRTQVAVFAIKHNLL